MDILNYSIQDFSHICRTCLHSENDLTSIFDSKTAEMLNYCDFCTISENDGFPDQICCSCIQVLEQCYKFKQQCENSFSVLAKLLSTHEESDDRLHCMIEDSVNDLKNSNDCNNEEHSVESNEDSRNYMLVVKSNDENVVLPQESSSRNCTQKFLDVHQLNEHKKTGDCSKLFRTDAELNEQIENTLDLLESADQPIKENSDQENDDLISFLDKPLPPPLQYCCQNCNQSFSEENDLKIHQSIHSSDLICLACLKKFTNRQVLKRHLKIHLIRKPHVCKICSKSFSESYALTKHLRRHSGIPREKKHFCTECGQGFSEPYYLKVHLRKHTGERPLLCSVCDKAFADPRSLKIHLMIHSGEKPHKCSFCLKGFNQRANLTKHLRIHTGEKPYVCKICDKKFSQSSSLDKHQRTHTGKKHYACDKCDKRFSEKSSLNNHIKIHTESRAYICKHCFSSTESKSALLLHCKQHSRTKSVSQVCGKKFAGQERSHTDAEESFFECRICFRKFSNNVSFNKHSTLHGNDLHDGNNSYHCSKFEQLSADLDGDNLYSKNAFL